MRTDVHRQGQDLIDMVVSMGPSGGSELRFVMLTTNRSKSTDEANSMSDGSMGRSEALMSPKFEQVVR